MASQKDIKPGTFETIANQAIGTFILNEWTHIKLDGARRFLMSNIVLKDGATPIPGSAFEQATDSAATAQEVGKTDQNLRGQIRITNNTYVGITLNISGNNFGAYVSNESSDEAIATAVFGKVAPGSDAFIEAGEHAVFDSSSGKSIISDNSGETALWDAGPVYNTAGQLVRAEGITASATGEALNQNKFPLLLVNSPSWYIPPDEDDMLQHANQGDKMRAGMHPIHDIQSAVYAQNLRVGKKKINGTQQEFHIIHLDGTQLTGNTTLENLMDVGGPNENPFIDIYAPDELGTRTFLNSQGHGSRAMTGGGGVAPILGEVQIDEQLRITGDSGEMNLGGSRSVIRQTGQLGAINGRNSNNIGGDSGVTGTAGYDGFLFDSDNSVTPIANRTNDVENRVKSIVEGVSYIYAMQEA